MSQQNQLFLNENNCALSCLITTSIISVCSLILIYQIYKIFHYPGKIETDTLDYCSSDKMTNDSKVYAFVFKGSGKSISSSPFSVKLSSYLRLTGIPHVIKEADVMKAPKGKVPYIKHHEACIGDSQLILRYLENTFDVAAMSKANKTGFIPYSDLSSTDKALCEMIRLTCEGQLYWALVSIRWLGFAGVSGLESNWHATVASYFDAIPSIIRSAFTSMIRVSVYNDSRSFGLSRHSAKDQCYLIFRALDALSATLGTKQYFLGDFPAECDCIAFGTLQGLCEDDLWPNPISSYIRTDCPNLLDFNNRMRISLYRDFTLGDRLPQSVEASKIIPIMKQREKSD
jgi:glutathione S-transferase